MAITSSQKNSDRQAQLATGAYLDSAATPEAMTITLGFNPRYVRVTNLTTRVQHEWMDGMAATHTLKIAANGDATDDTNSAIVINTSNTQTPNADDLSVVSGAAYQSTMPGSTTQVCTFTFFAAGIAQNDQLHWQAMA